MALAKQVASLYAISSGRMTLGIGLGGREDDYEIAGVDTATRGRDLDAMLARIEEVWEGEEMGPDLAAFEGAGCGELFLFPSSSDPGRSTSWPMPPASSADPGGSAAMADDLPIHLFAGRRPISRPGWRRTTPAPEASG